MTYFVVDEFQVFSPPLVSHTLSQHYPIRQAPYFRLSISQDEVGVELCGALKNVIAIAAGVATGLKFGDNTKSAVLRLGFWEMLQLMKELYPNRGRLIPK